MQPPLIFKDLFSLLKSLCITASLVSFVLAGMRLRNEGGVNYQASGGFLKWLFWGALLATIPGVTTWMAQEKVPGADQLVNMSTTTPYVAAIERISGDFVYDLVIDHFVPLVAASLVLKALLDQSQGTTPVASIVTAMFLLGVQGIYKLATGNWLKSGAYSTTDLLMNAFNYAIGTLCPIIGGLAVAAGILAFVQRKDWKGFVVSGIGFLCATGVWAMVKSWAGVTIP